MTPESIIAATRQARPDLAAGDLVRVSTWEVNEPPGHQPRSASTGIFAGWRWDDYALVTHRGTNGVDLDYQVHWRWIFETHENARALIAEARASRAAAAITREQVRAEREQRRAEA